MKFHHLISLAAGAIILTACDKPKETATNLEQKAKETAAKAEDKVREAIKATEGKAKEIASTAKEKFEDAGGSANAYTKEDKAAFNAALEPIKKLCEEMKDSDPAAEPPFDKMSEFVAAMKALPTKGMPADLQAAMGAANDNTEELIETMKSIATDPASLTPEVLARIKELRAQGKTLSEKAIELAVKQGIDLSFFDLMN